MFGHDLDDNCHGQNYHDILGHDGHDIDDNNHNGHDIDDNNDNDILGPSGPVLGN